MNTFNEYICLKIIYILDIILNYAQASAKKIEIVVEKGFLVDYILGNNIDAYGILNWLSDVKGEVIPIVWKPYQASVATISKFAYITAYSATWIGYAIPSSFLFKQIKAKNSALRRLRRS